MEAEEEAHPVKESTLKEEENTYFEAEKDIRHINQVGVKVRAEETICLKTNEEIWFGEETTLGV